MREKVRTRKTLFGRKMNNPYGESLCCTL